MTNDETRSAPESPAGRGGTPTPEIDTPPLLEIGRIARSHGLRGDVVVKLTTDRLERVAPGAELVADGRTLLVQSSRPHQTGFIVSFGGVGDRSAADRLRGLVLWAEAIEDDSVVWVHELIGARMVEIDGTDRGTIASIEANPASDLAILESGAMVPLVFMTDGPVDGVVTIDPPAGLFDV